VYPPRIHIMSSVRSYIFYGLHEMKNARAERREKKVTKRISALRPPPSGDGVITHSAGSVQYRRGKIISKINIYRIDRQMSDKECARRASVCGRDSVTKFRRFRSRPAATAASPSSSSSYVRTYRQYYNIKSHHYYYYGYYRVLPGIDRA